MAYLYVITLYILQRARSELWNYKQKEYFSQKVGYLTIYPLLHYFLEISCDTIIRVINYKRRNLMYDTMIKNRVGKTPLFRAERLEQELGISKIFLKLEGNNPSGHRLDRLAYLLIKDALSSEKKSLCMGVFGTLAQSISFFASHYGLECIFVLPDNHKAVPSKLSKIKNSRIIKYGKTQKDCIEYCQKLSKENNWYNATPVSGNDLFNMTAQITLAEELSLQSKEDIHTVFSQMGYNSSSSGLCLGFTHLWTLEKSKNIPLFYSCTSDKSSAVNNKPIKQPLNLKVPVSSNAFSKNHEKIISITNIELNEYVSKIKNTERIKMDMTNGYAVAGFIKEAQNGNLSKGNHIILLNDGRIDLEIRQIKKEENIISSNKIAELINEWLMEYTDPIEEIYNALENAFEKGLVLIAYHNNHLSGIAIIVNTGFNSFATQFHLAYIATKKSVKGRGIATHLLHKSIQLTNGNISLHVEKDNQKAIKLYEKMGFKSCYQRMIYTYRK
jgi:threonine synthase